MDTNKTAWETSLEKHYKDSIKSLAKKLLTIDVASSKRIVFDGVFWGIYGKENRN